MARHCAGGHGTISLSPQLQQLDAHDLCQALQACHLRGSASQVSLCISVSALESITQWDR